jgi:heme/copper-type cytochrome/quinol oxidase subunit 2
MDAAASPQAGLTLATWFWLLVPMLVCVVMSIATYFAAAAKRRRGRHTATS